MRALILTVALLLAGCAQYTWQHPGLDPAAAERARQIDIAECTAAAMQAITLPNPPQAPAVAAPSEYSLNGTTTVYGPDGEVNTGYYSGTARASSSGGDRAADGIAAFQAREDHSDAINARNGLANACMLRRGWVKVRSGQEPMPAPAVALAAPPVSTVQASAPMVTEEPAPLPPPTPAASRYSEWSMAPGH
jgi:hypothetical protein